MSASILYEVVQDRAASVRVFAGRTLSAWLGNGHGVEDTAILRNVGDLIGEAATFPDALRRLCRSTALSIQARQVDDYAREGEALQRVFDSALGALEKLGELVRALEDRTGHPASGHVELDAAKACVLQLRAHTLGHWPWPPGDKDIRQVREEMLRGEGMELDEAFAAIAGTTPEEWKRRVDERKQSRIGGVEGV